MCVHICLTSFTWFEIIRVVACINASFLFVNDTPLYGHITFCLSILQLITTWVVSTFWLFGIMLL